MGIEAFIGLGLGLLVGREFEPRGKEASSRLKIARTLYVPALFGGFTFFDSTKNKEVNAAAKGLGIAAGLAISYFTKDAKPTK